MKIFLSWSGAHSMNSDSAGGITCWLLRDIMKLSNELDYKFPLTLFSSGMIIAGVTISGAQYFALLGEQIEESMKPVAPDPAFAAKMGASFRNHKRLEKWRIRT